MGRIFDDRLSFRSGLMVVMEQVEKEGVAFDQVREVMTTSDTKEFFLKGINEFLADPDAPQDNNWQQLFREIPGTGHGDLFPFRAPTAAGAGSHGIVFKRVGENGEIEFSRTGATAKYVQHVKYGTAFAYSNEWFEDGSMNLIEMVTEDFRDAANDKLAAIHYAAFAAAVTAGISNTTAAGGTTINHFINTLNARSVVMRRNRRAPTILLIAPEQEMFVRIALQVRVGNNQPGTNNTSATEMVESVSRLKVLVSEHLPAGTGYLIEPRRRLISTRRRDLRIETMRDILHDADTIAGTFRRGLLVAEGEVIEAITSIPSSLPVS